MEAKVYTKEGKESGKTKLPESVFGAKWNPEFVHEVVILMQGNARAGTAHAKDRSEVRGGGRKPWRQKGTGRARHGSRRSPIWAGGGVTFGPRNEKNYTKKINRKVRARALSSVLSKKYEDGEIIFVDSLTFKEPKAKDARDILTSLGGIKGMEGVASKKKNAALIVLSNRDIVAEKSFRNFGNVLVTQVKDVNPVELLTYKYVVVAKPKDSLEVLQKRVSVKSEKETGKKTKTTAKA